MGSTHMVDHANSYDHYDSLFCVGPHHERELRRRELLAGLRERHLFHYGYHRLEELLHQAQARPTAPPAAVPTVLVAPTWGDDSIFNRCGRVLLQELLEAGLQVIMRPHYHTRRLSPQVLDELIREFSPHPRFEVVERMGESDSLFRSDLLVSDWSAMAIEYALGLEKPVLFIDLPRRIRNPDWQDWQLEPFESAIRAQVGAVLDPAQLAQAPAAIRRLLDNPGAHAQRVRELRRQVVYNPQGCAAPGAREIARLADANRANAGRAARAHG
jgi:YidC/Oxa1 family membrane protein insertase